MGVDEIMYGEVLAFNFDKYYSEGRAEGIAQGRAEGIAQGRAEGIAQGRAEGIAQGRAEGIAEGKSEGITTFRNLVKQLTKLGRMDDVVRVAEDSQYLGKLLEEFQLKTAE